jgi:hypothetical protein
MKTGKMGFVFSLLILVGFGVWHESSKPKAPPHVVTAEEKAAKDKDAERFARVTAGGNAIKASANNPDSIKFRRVMIFDSGAVCYEFTGSNAFGGIVQNYAVLPAGSSQVAFNKAAIWNKQCDGAGYNVPEWLSRLN